MNKPTFASNYHLWTAFGCYGWEKDTRWAAAKAENEWIYVDLGSVQPVGGVRLDWEASFVRGIKFRFLMTPRLGKKCIKLMRDVEESMKLLSLKSMPAGVRMFGIELGWWFGYSLWSFVVLGGTQPSEGLSDVHILSV